jgi:hypothetical protein
MFVLSSNVYMYIDVLPGNESVSSGFWIYYLGLLDKSSGGITIKYNTLYLIVITLR